MRQKPHRVVHSHVTGSPAPHLSSCGRSWGSPGGGRGGGTGSGTARTRGTTGSGCWFAAAASGSSRRRRWPPPTLAWPWCLPPPPARTPPPPRPGRPNRRCGDTGGTAATVGCCHGDTSRAESDRCYSLWRHGQLLPWRSEQHNSLRWYSQLLPRIPMQLTVILCCKAFIKTFPNNLNSR